MTLPNRDPNRNMKNQVWMKPTKPPMYALVNAGAPSVASCGKKAMPLVAATNRAQSGAAMSSSTPRTVM